MTTLCQKTHSMQFTTTPSANPLDGVDAINRSKIKISKAIHNLLLDACKARLDFHEPVKIKTLEARNSRPRWQCTGMLRIKDIDLV